MTHAAITENKRLSDVLAYIKERQEQLPVAEAQNQQREEWLQTAWPQAGQADGFYQ